MMINIFKCVLIMLLLVAFVGCRGVVRYKDVDSEISIQILEKLPSRNLLLHFSTAKIYGVCDNVIDLSWHHTPSGIDILFKGVIECGMLTAIGPATATINLGELNPGAYPLVLRNGEEKFTGELLVFSDKYSISLGSFTAFNVINSPLNRIPDSTIWGIVGYHNEETAPLVKSFFSELMELGATKKSFNPGNYNRFEIDENGNIINYNAGYHFNQAFIFYYAEDSSELDSFLKQWLNLYGELMRARIYTDKGEMF